MASLEDVMRTLGRLEEGVERLRVDFKEEKDTAHDSRTAIHRRLDEHVGVISSLKTDVAISAQVDAQVRNELAALKEAVEPSLAEWKRMKSIGLGLAGLLALGGISIGALIAYTGDVAVTAIRHWLKIN